MDEVHAVYKALYEKGRFIGGWLPPPPEQAEAWRATLSEPPAQIRQGSWRLARPHLN